jgi:hypothetical protein
MTLLKRLTLIARSEPSTWRIRYFNIRPDQFSWTADPFERRREDMDDRIPADRSTADWSTTVD